MPQLLTFALLLILFIPKQLDSRIPIIIFAYSVLLLPFFFKNLTGDLQHKYPPTIFFIAFIIAAAISTIFSIDPNRSIIQLALYISYFVIFTSIGSIFSTVANRERLALFFLLIICLLSLVSLYHTIILHYVNRDVIGSSFLWNYFGHNHLSSLLIFAIPLSLYFLKAYWRRRGLRFIMLVASCYLLFTLLMTFSRGSAVSLAAAALVGVSIPGMRIVVNIRVIGAVLALLIIFTFLAGTAQKNALLFGVQKSEPSHSRIVYWQNALANFQKNPLIGSGPDTFRIIDRRQIRKFPPGSDFVHNFFLQQATDMGILGLVTSLGLIGSVLWQGVAKIKNLKFKIENFLFVALLASTFNSMIDFDWQLPMGFLIFWLLTDILKKPTE